MAEPAYENEHESHIWQRNKARERTTAPGANARGYTSYHRRLDLSFGQVS